jgi:alanyl-tRNA synthetase
MDANTLRRAFTDFFVERGHALVPSSGLVPHHPTAPMFTNSGMIPFVPYFLGEEEPPWRRATSVQKCVRLSGKHNDIDEVGRTRWHCTFFEMLGNWSFGDYFKEDAIAMAWELLTEVVGFDGNRLWVTVHTSDDDAEQIWRDRVGFPGERIQRLDEENFWQMADTGPCGPDTEIHYDCGPEWGDEGGPAHGDGHRYVEIWNLVFMELFRHDDGSLTDLPRKNVDTGAGLERWLTLLQDVPTVFDTDALQPLVAQVAGIAGQRYGSDDRVDYYLRSVADHARCMAFLVNDGVAPSNADRGYVLRSVIRRAVRRGYQLGIDRPFLLPLVDTVVDQMGEAYPDLVRNADGVKSILEREEVGFRQTLESGSAMLETELEAGEVSGEAAFKLHDTFGFPIELTEEIAGERGVTVDRSGFDAAMAAQRRRAKESRQVAVITAGSADGYRQLLDEHGPTEFTGYQEFESKGKVLAVLETSADDGTEVEVYLDRTPFYAEGGGQVGDTGTLTTDTGVIRVTDTTYALPGLHRHVGVIEQGTVEAGQDINASIDAERREAIRRNHTGTHLLHWALREVLGPQVKQQSSYVGPDYLRFDINHHAPLTPEQIATVEDMVNGRVLDDEPVRAYETTITHAQELGAIAFFGDKYGEYVRVVEAGDRSMELCGGTHVPALGTIGPLKITSEGSIGSNLRRVEAITGTSTLERMRQHDTLLLDVAEKLRANPDEILSALDRALHRQRELEKELKALRSKAAQGQAGDLAAAAEKGYVVARLDGLDQDQLRELATAVRGRPDISGAVLIGSPDGARVALVAAMSGDGDTPTAPEIVRSAAAVVGGGGGGKDPRLAMAGGKDVARIDEAIAHVRASLGLG